MPRLRYVEINGQKLIWKDVVAAYREQAKAAARPEQPMLFSDLKTDYRGPGERSASERYLSPSLFDSLKL
jgi:hypothetical protein